MDAAIAERLVQFSSNGTPKADDLSRGPTPTSCWLIPGLVLWGDLPRGPKLAALVECGVSHFLDVRGSASNYVSTALHSYQHLDLPTLLASNSQQAISQCASALRQVLNDVLAQDNGVLYLHCEDGHALSGVVASILLAMVFGLTGMKAVAVASQLHGARADDEGVHHLLTAQQKAFVRDVVNSRPMTMPVATAPSGSVGTPVLDDLQRANTSSRPSSRFEHSRGGGGGYTSINLFSQDGRDMGSSHNNNYSISHRSSVQPPSAPQSPQRTLSAVVPDSPLQSQRSVASLGRSSTSHRTSPLQAEGEPYAHGGNHLHAQHFTVVMDRPSLAHAWGLVLAGNVVRYVLPLSPAAHAGVAPGCILRAVDNGEFSADLSFDWITQSRLGVRLSLSDGGEAAYRLPSPSRESVDAHPTPPLSLAASTPPSAKPVAPRMMDVRTEARLVSGPFPQSNWVVRDAVLCGPVPDPRKRTAFNALVATNIDIFVSLVESEATSDAYLKAYHEAVGNNHAQCVWFPMEDGAPIVAKQFEPLLQLANDILKWSTEDGRRVYVHCRNGHGRTGIVVSCVLALLFQLPGMKAVNYCDALHSCRLETEDQSSPQTQEQRLSVVSLLGKSTLSQ